MKPDRDSWSYRTRVGVLAWLGAGLLRVLGATWRLSVTGPSPFEGGPIVGALWHQGLLVAAVVWRGSGVAVPVSKSRDGDQIDAVLQRLGFAESPRGSSSRGASSLLRAMIRRVRGGNIVAMLPDGPRGPGMQAKPGVIALASAAGVPIVPVGVAARPAIRFGSWDRAILPWPFARVVCCYGEPFEVPKKLRGEALEARLAELETELHRMNHEAEARLHRMNQEAEERLPPR